MIDSIIVNNRRYWPEGQRPAADEVKISVESYTMTFHDQGDEGRFVKIECSTVPEVSPYGVLYRDALVVDCGPENVRSILSGRRVLLRVSALFYDFLDV